MTFFFFDGWSWKTRGHLFYATSSFVHHFIVIGEFKLKLQSGNAQYGSNSTIIFSRVTLKFDGWPWITIGHLFQATSSCVHHSIIICEFKLELQSGNGYVGFWPLWPLTLTFSMDLTFVIGDNSRKFHDDTMMGTQWKRCDRRADGQIDGQTENTICTVAWSQLKTPFYSLSGKTSYRQISWNL